MNKKKLISIFLLLGVIFMLSFVSAAEEDISTIGTAKKGECVSLYQYCPTCSYSNIEAIGYPDGTIENSNSYSMTKTNNNFNYSFCGTNQTGDYFYTVCGDKGNVGYESCEKIVFEVTQAGVSLDRMNETIKVGVLFLFFLIAGSFLFLSTQTKQPGIKIFFILTAFVFIIGSLASSYIVVNETSVTNSLGNVVIGMLYAFGLIFFVIFAYILINQIQSALNLMRINKGYEEDF